MVLSYLRVKRTRKCRNWQTSKTKDLVINAIVWVQVPSSAYWKLWKLFQSFFYFFTSLFSTLFTTLIKSPKSRLITYSFGDFYNSVILWKFLLVLSYSAVVSCAVVSLTVVVSSVVSSTVVVSSSNSSTSFEKASFTVLSTTYTLVSSFTII